MMFKTLKSKTNLVSRVPYKSFFMAINWSTLKSCDLKFLLHSSVSVFSNLFSCKFLACECHNFLNLAKSIRPFYCPYTWYHLNLVVQHIIPEGPYHGLGRMDSRSCDVGVELKQWQAKGRTLSHLASKLERNFVSVLFRKLCTFSILELPWGL